MSDLGQVFADREVVARYRHRPPYRVTAPQLLLRPPVHLGNGDFAGTVAVGVTTGNDTRNHWVGRADSGTVGRRRITAGDGPVR